jgi:hypothetical protein
MGTPIERGEVRDAHVNEAGVSRRNSLFIWGVFCILVGMIFLAYVFASLAAGRGELLMPLDDAYIHFQYARQLAAGQPYVYNPGLPPSSGATGFLYPYLLAIGYLVGFQGLNLGLWAMTLGALALLASTWLVYKLSEICDAPEWFGIVIAVIFALTGAVSWHFMSGMETGLVILLVLLTLYTILRQSLRATVMAATLLTLTRPEGGIFAVFAMIAMFLQLRRSSSPPRVRGGGWGEGLLLIPVLAVGVQPLVNWLFTGSAVASGNSAKSLFGMIPPYPDVILLRIADNFLRMWSELFTSTSPREGIYIPYPGLFALGGLAALLASRERRWLGGLLVAWLLAGTLAVATLDPAFWHFKRYQMPVMALFFPLAAAGVAFALPRWRPLRPLIIAGSVISLAFAIWTGVQFLQHYALNVDYIYLQPLQMARWLQANTPVNATVAVHDTGLMRYQGGRTTLDMVGLTTPGAAEYWRNGPGSVAEFLMQERPDYIASYGHGHGLGLGMIADTSIYGEPLASFPVELDPNFNVALAGDFQGIYRPDWEKIISWRNTSLQPYDFNYWARGSLPTGDVDVANLAREAQQNYHWRNDEQLPGFPTEIYEQDYISCSIENCRLVDGGRLINGEESFDLGTWYDSGQSWNVILVTRLHPAYTGTFDVYANDVFVDTQWIPSIPGRWLEVATFIPEEIATDPTHIRIVPHVSGGYYMPYYHWAYGMSDSQILPMPGDMISTFQNGAFLLSRTEIRLESDASQMEVAFDWYTDGSAQGDYKIFIHVLNDAGETVAQADQRPGQGTLPPGNWLPGVLHDTIMVDLSNVQPGHYRVAIGFYDPITFERLAPSSGDAENRLFIGEVEIVDHG